MGGETTSSFEDTFYILRESQSVLSFPSIGFILLFLVHYPRLTNSSPFFAYI